MELMVFFSFGREKPWVEAMTSTSLSSASSLGKEGGTEGRRAGGREEGKEGGREGGREGGKGGEKRRAEGREEREGGENVRRIEKGENMVEGLYKTWPPLLLPPLTMSSPGAGPRAAGPSSPPAPPAR